MLNNTVDPSRRRMSNVAARFTERQDVSAQGPLSTANGLRMVVSLVAADKGLWVKTSCHSFNQAAELHAILLL